MEPQTRKGTENSQGKLGCLAERTEQAEEQVTGTAPSRIAGKDVGPRKAEGRREREPRESEQTICFMSHEGSFLCSLSNSDLALEGNKHKPSEIPRHVTQKDLGFLSERTA